jgi:hypothetical protein
MMFPIVNRRSVILLASAVALLPQMTRGEPAPALNVPVLAAASDLIVVGKPDAGAMVRDGVRIFGIAVDRVVKGDASAVRGTARLRFEPDTRIMCPDWRRTSACAPQPVRAELVEAFP